MSTITRIYNSIVNSNLMFKKYQFSPKRISHTMNVQPITHISSQIKRMSIDNEEKTIMTSIEEKTYADILPFTLDMKKYDFISQSDPSIKKEEQCKVDLLLSEENKLPNSVKERLSLIMTDSFNNLCNHEFEGKYYKGGRCHHFVNYLAFGMAEQEGYDFSDWYVNLPFIKVLPFEESALQQGDIVQFFKDKKLQHSLYYIGDKKYLNKHGTFDIYFQTFSGATKAYSPDSYRILRPNLDKNTESLEFKQCYNDEGWCILL